ncbi:unnamed protein product [Calypogeia fissa]
MASWERYCKRESIFDLLSSVKNGDLKTVQDRLQKAQKVDSQQFTELLMGTDSLGMNALHHAAWDGHVEIVVELLGYRDIDVNAMTNAGFTALHLASWNNRVEVVEKLVVLPSVDLLARCGQPLSFLSCLQNNIKAQSWLLERNLVEHFPGLMLDFRGPPEKSRFLHPDMYNKRITALHIAALAGHTWIVELFVRKLGKLSSSKAHKALNAIDNKFMTPLHYAVIGGDSSVVAEFLSTSVVRANLEELSENSTPLEMAFILIHRAQDRPDLAHEFNLMISMLLERPDVKGLMENLYSDRQVFVDAANGILVGAALIASISFAGWLQPPLGYQPYYEANYLVAGVAPPDTFPSYAAVKQQFSVQVFWILNSLAFFCAIATILTGAGAVLPCREIIGNDEVEHVRTLLIRTSMVLSFSVFFVLGAFIAAGFASLPPTLNYQWGMIGTSVVGGSVGIICLCYYYRRIFRLFRFRDGVLEGGAKGISRTVPRAVSGGFPRAVSRGFKQKVSFAVHELFDHRSEGAYKYCT